MRCAPVRRANQRQAAVYDFRRTIIIAGVQRGGSTWLAELLASTGDMTLLWEPLHVAHPRNRADLRFALDYRASVNPGQWWIPYIPQYAQWPDAEDFFRRLLSGQILHGGLFVSAADVPRRVTRQYLVKFCRANCLLPWLVKNFPTQLPVLLVRHPCAVVASKFRHRPAAKVKPPYVITAARYSAEYHQSYREYLATLESREEIFAAQWCLEHLIPLNHPWNNQRWITVSYERLVKSGVDEFRLVCDRLGQSVPSSIESRLTLPSRTTVDGSPILEGGDQLSGWRKHLTVAQIERVLAVVEHFGLADVYSEGLEPNYDRLLAPGPMATVANAPSGQQAA